MKLYVKYFIILLVSVFLYFSCAKRQEIPLYEEQGQVSQAVDSLYNAALKMYKAASYKRAINILQGIVEKYPTNRRIDNVVHLILLSKYRLKDYKGLVSTARREEGLYKGKPAEQDISYLIALALEKINENYDAAKEYFHLLKVSKKKSLRTKASSRITDIVKNKLNFSELKILADKYEKTSLGCLILYYAAKRAMEQGKNFEARKIETHMKRLYPNNSYTIQIDKALKEGKKVVSGTVIGFLGPLTGEYSIFGKQVKRGFELAMKGYGIRIVERDTRGNAIEAIKQTVYLIKKENAFVIIGPILSMPTISAAGVSNLLKVPIISPTATKEGISSIGPYVFQLNVGLGVQAKEMAKFVTGELGYYKVAILYPDDAYGNSLANIFSSEARRLGIEIVAQQSYSEGTTDFGTQIKFIKDRKPQAIYIPCYPDEAVMIAPELKYYKINAQILGADGWNEENVAIKGDKYVEGVIFTGNPTMIYKNTQQFKDFKSLYIAEYKKEPTREAALGYDAGVLILKAFAEGAKNSQDVANILNNILPFAGASGVVNPKGVFEGKVPFFTIKNGYIVKLGK
ncbi:MAG: hypothetical protein B5M53_08330 [Candidatus Cloacimonas sp. 4484_209]|nr:MAG: hypothetical protein B5M53_08330 [Candidatus Cloacimonas sp. 4484_209]